MTWRYSPHVPHDPCATSTRWAGQPRTKVLQVFQRLGSLNTGFRPINKAERWDTMAVPALRSQLLVATRAAAPWVAAAARAQQQGSDSGAGGFARAAEELRTRLSNAVEAERQGQVAALRRLYARSSLAQLREEGVVLTQLSGELESRLFAEFVWKLSAPTGQELPYHKFSRGDSLLISWGQEAEEGGGGGRGRRRAGAAGTKRPEPPPPGWMQQQQGEVGTAGSSGDGGEGSASEGEGGLAESVEGTVLEVRRGHLLVTLPKNASETLQAVVDGGALLRVDMGDKDTTSQRQLQALGRLTTFNNPKNMGELRVRVVLLGGDTSCAAQPPKWAESQEEGSWLRDARTVLHALPNLNTSQRAAIVEAMQRSFSLWQGPPGTGKTRTLLGLMHTMCTTNRLRRSWAESMGPILAAADTNAAADIMVAGLLERGVRVVRVGQPAKVRPELREACLDALMENTAPGRRAAYLRADADRCLRDARAGKLAGSLSPQEVAQLRREADRCWAEAEESAAEAVQQVLRQAEVVAATCTGCGDPRLSNMNFKVVVIDEASQATEPSTLIPLVKGAECVVMAGDIKQLPPTVISTEALEYDLDVPLLARLQRGGMPARLLDVQYRMHPAIAQFPSQHFYQGRVRSGISHEDRPLLQGVPWVGGRGAAACPVLFLHCEGKEKRAPSGGKMLANVDSPAERQAEGGSSFQNESEAGLAIAVLRKVLQENADLASIAILTPYNGQKRLLTRMLRELAGWGGVPEGVEVEVSTVDGYQGREADAVIFSTVRSRPPAEVQLFLQERQGEAAGPRKNLIGFVADQRRLNVAITRARRGLIVVGNGTTLRTDPNWAAWLRWLMQAHQAAATAASAPAAAAEAAPVL